LNLVTLSHPLEGQMPVLDSLAGKLHLQIGVNGWGRRFSLWEVGAHDNHRKLRPPNVFYHVKIAVAVSGVEGLNRHRNKEITLSCVANAFASCPVTDAIDLMHGMGYVIGYG
jgi:hypothetical protein